MKKYVFTLLLMATCHLGFAQSVDRLFDEFRKERNADYIHVSPFLMQIGKIVASSYDDSGIVRRVHSTRILDLDNCSDEQRSRFRSRLGGLKDEGYEVLIQMNDDGEQVYVLARRKKDVIRQLIIGCVDRDDCTLVQIKGNIRQKDIERLIKDQTRRRHGRH